VQAILQECTEGQVPAEEAGINGHQEKIKVFSFVVLSLHCLRQYRRYTCARLDYGFGTRKNADERGFLLISNK
jgi:hypothetical protein